jgi:hypothetical protein
VVGCAVGREVQKSHRGGREIGEKSQARAICYPKGQRLKLTQAIAREASAARCIAIRRVDSAMRLMGTGFEK